MSFKKIFISHAHLDANIVERIVDILEVIGVSETAVFCSSLPGYGIPLGVNYLDDLKERLNEEVLVLFILSKNFYKSPISLCEMGAAWVKSNQCIPIMIPGFTANDIRGVFPNNIAMDITEKAKLNELKLLLENYFSINTPKSFTVWERKRDTIIDDIKRRIIQKRV